MEPMDALSVSLTAASSRSPRDGPPFVTCGDIFPRYRGKSAQRERLGGSKLPPYGVAIGWCGVVGGDVLDAPISSPAAMRREQAPALRGCNRLVRGRRGDVLDAPISSPAAMRREQAPALRCCNRLAMDRRGGCPHPPVPFALSVTLRVTPLPKGEAWRDGDPSPTGLQ